MESGKGGGVFSAAESTIPRQPCDVVAASEVSENEPEPEPPEPAVVVVPPIYGPVWGVDGGGGRKTSLRMHQRPAPRVVVLRVAPVPLVRPPALFSHQGHMAFGGRAMRP